MHNPEKKIIRLLKLFTGILIISGLISILGWVKLPGGTLSATIRHNIEEDIDATPIFYGDVENMGELEAGLQELIENSPNR